MSHPQSPRVSTNSEAAHALSQAGNDQPRSTAEADATAGDTGDTAGTAGATNSADSSYGAALSTGKDLLGQAQRWLQDSGLQNTLTQIPEPVKRVASQAAGRVKSLTPTQLAIGGALVAAGSWYLLSRKGRSGNYSTTKRSKSGAAATLHELLLFVNDRIEGYQRAVEESKDAQLRGYYQQLVSQSQRFARELNDHLRREDGGEEKGTTLKGKLYRAWMETKAAVTGYDEKAILGSNVYGEEWAIKAYQEALDDHTLTGALRAEVQRQYSQSQQTYQKLKRLQEQQA